MRVEVRPARLRGPGFDSRHLHSKSPWIAPHGGSGAFLWMGQKLGQKALRLRRLTSPPAVRRGPLRGKARGSLPHGKDVLFHRTGFDYSRALELSLWAEADRRLPYPPQTLAYAEISAHEAPVSPTVQMLEKLLLETCVPLGYRRDVERHRQRGTLFRWGWRESPRTDRFISPKEQPLRESERFTALSRSLNTIKPSRSARLWANQTNTQDRTTMAAIELTIDEEKSRGCGRGCPERSWGSTSRRGAVQRHWRISFFSHNTAQTSRWHE